ncbi:uncharacterized protein LOC143775161 [Ranitomeya variabilis]|uniref:uncharacterized protein LOC143775161 n=1 Tax=Ranitomeya variabilis TaxID=490064 RepID=UPI004057B7A5
MTCNESLSCYDIMTWLGRYGEVVEMPKKNRDEFGIWSGAWTFMVKLKRSGGTVAHIPSSAFLGRDRILVFYQGQPKLCHRCGDPTHFSANCTVQKCALCGDIGHLAASCVEIRCHLCGELGHPFSRCPRSFANAVVTPVGESREADSAGEGTSRGEGAEGPRKKSNKKTPAQLRRLDKRRQDRELGEPRATGAAPVLDASLAAEAPRDDELDEEVRRIHREESATASESSHYESMDEDNRQWLENKRKLGTKKKRKKGDKKSSPALTKVPKEGKTDSPLVGLSNRFQALENISSSEEEAEGEVLASAGLTGDAESPASGNRAATKTAEGSNEDGRGQQRKRQRAALKAAEGSNEGSRGQQQRQQRAATKAAEGSNKGSRGQQQRQQRAERKAAEGSNKGSRGQQQRRQRAATKVAEGSNKDGRGQQQRRQRAERKEAEGSNEGSRGQQRRRQRAATKAAEGSNKGGRGQQRRRQRAATKAAEGSNEGGRGQQRRRQRAATKAEEGSNEGGGGQQQRRQMAATKAAESSNKGGRGQQQKRERAATKAAEGSNEGARGQQQRRQRTATKVAEGSNEGGGDITQREPPGDGDVLSLLSFNYTILSRKE